MQTLKAGRLREPLLQSPEIEPGGEPIDETALRCEAARAKRGRPDDLSAHARD